MLILASSAISAFILLLYCFSIKFNFFMELSAFQMKRTVLILNIFSSTSAALANGLKRSTSLVPGWTPCVSWSSVMRTSQRFWTDWELEAGVQRTQTHQTWFSDGSIELIRAAAFLSSPVQKHWDQQPDQVLKLRLAKEDPGGPRWTQVSAALSIRTQHAASDGEGEGGPSCHPPAGGQVGQLRP